MTNIVDLNERRLHMLVTKDLTPPNFETDLSKLLYQFEQLSGATILEDYNRQQAKFATAPFDVEGHMLRFYRGGLTIWSGFPGAGKTTLLRQFICHMLNRGSSVFLASLEEEPQISLIRLASTAAGTPEPNSHQVQWFLDAYAERLRLWSVPGLAEHRRLLGTVRTLAAIGVRHMVIDSLSCLDIRNDDFEAQRQLANLAAAVARICKIHIHLVAHPRKLVKADQELDLNDVAGAREIGAIADNVIFVRRGADNAAFSPNSQCTPMRVSIRKQRHFQGALGDITGWYHRNLCQFSIDQFPNGPARYLPDDAFDPTFLTAQLEHARSQ